MVTVINGSAALIKLACHTPVVSAAARPPLSAARARLFKIGAPNDKLS
jgi:hypothetical protein